MSSELSGRFGFVRASVSSGFRAPTPGQQNGFNISTMFDPTLGDLVNNGTIPSISPVALSSGCEPISSDFYVGIGEPFARGERLTGSPAQRSTLFETAAIFGR